MEELQVITKLLDGRPLFHQQNNLILEKLIKIMNDLVCILHVSTQLFSQILGARNVDFDFLAFKCFIVALVYIV